MHQIPTTSAAHRATAAMLTLGVLTLLSGACSDASGPTGFSARPVAGALLQGQAGKLPKIAFSAGGFGSMSIYTMNSDGTGRTEITSGHDDLTPTWSPDRRKLAFVRSSSGDGTIYTMTSKGARITLAGPGNNPSWSPDGARIAFDWVLGGNGDIWVRSPDGLNNVRLTSDAAIDEDPTWSPDGKRIAFRSTRTGTSEIFVMNADGSSQTRLTFCDSQASACTTPVWSPAPGSDRIAFASVGTIDGLFTVKADGTGLTAVATFGDGIVTDPSWSPDGTHLVFARVVSPVIHELYRINVDGTGLTRLTSNNLYDRYPAWAR